MYLTKRQRHNSMRAQLDRERSSFIPLWRDLGDYILPSRPRFTIADGNRGDRRNLKIIDPTATIAARTLASGMMSGITSPARPWFRLTTPDPDLAEFGRVKDWLHLVGQRQAMVYARSNIYNILPTIYGDTGVFATGALLIEEDFDTVIHTASFPIGSYMIGKDHRGVVNTFFREFRLTVRQLVLKFGKQDQNGKPDWSNFSERVKVAWDNGNYETWIEVCHAISPNPEYNPKAANSKNKKFESCYYEKACSDDQKYLRESGYDYFPVLCPRWETTGDDVYGTNSPGILTIGDVKQLQLGERRSMQAIEKMVNPPMIGPTSLRNQKASILPGDITWVDEREGTKGFRPAHDVQFRVLELEQKQQQVRQRIDKGFFADLFLMLANSDRRDITATEIVERKEEKLLALGPVLEQLNQDLLDPLTDITFGFMASQGWIPEAPEELQGIPLRIEYISSMAQAQKLIGIAGVERFLGFASQVVAANPETLDKINCDQVIDIYGDMTSVPPSLIRTDEDTAAIRQQRAQAMQAQQQAQQMQMEAKTAKDLSQTDLGDDDNALKRLIGQ